MKYIKRFEFILVPVICLLVYVSCGIEGEFVFDDEKLVLNNPALGSPSKVLSAFNVFSGVWEEKEVRLNYRPVRFLSYAIDWQLSEFLWPEAQSMPPNLFHLHNILLHAANSLLVFFLLQSLLPGRGRLPLFLSLVWALHPLQTEAVSYVSGRRDVLFALFYLGALVVYAKGNRGFRSFAGVIVLYVLSLLTKEMAVTLPAALILLDILLRRSWNRKVVLGNAAVWTFFAVYLVFKLGFKNPGGGAPYWGGTPAASLLTEARCVFKYIWLFLFPANLSVDWSYAALKPSEGLFTPWFTFPAVAGALLLAALSVYSFLRGRRLWGFGACLFLVTLAPVMQIVPHPERFAERFMYVPLIGLLCVSAPLLNTLRPTKTGISLGVVLLMALTGRTVNRNSDWQDRLSLWKSAVQLNPGCARANLALGLVFKDKAQKSWERGDKPEARSLWHQAESRFSRVLEVLGGKTVLTALQKGQLLQARAFRAQVRTRRADAKISRRNLVLRGSSFGEFMHKEAQELYEKAASDYETLLGQTDVDGTEIAKDPKQASTYSNLAAIRFRLEQYGKAEEAYRRILSLNPESPYAVTARFWLGMISIARGRITKGKQQILRVAAERSNTRQAFTFKANLANILKKVGRWESALALYEELLPHAKGEERITINYARAEILDRLGQRTEAILLLRDILAEKPGCLPAKLSLIDLELKEGRWRQVADEVKRLKEEHPGVPAVAAYEKQIKIQRALSRKEDKRQRRPVAPDTLLEAGRIHMKKRNWKLAVGTFKDAFVAAEAAEEGSTALVSLRYLARALRKSGRYTEALSVLRKALKRAPKDNRFLKDLGSLLAEDLKDVQQGAATYRKLYRLSEDDLTRIEACLELGDLYFRQHSIEEAALWYNRAAAIGTVPAKIHRRRGLLWEELGNAEKAKEAYKSYLETATEQQPRGTIEKRLNALTEAKHRDAPQEGEGSSTEIDKSM